MIILSPGALDKVFSTESSPTKATAQGSDSRFRNWLKPSDTTTATSADPSAGTTAPYKNRTTRFE